jgi:hypothetical protein
MLCCITVFVYSGGILCNKIFSLYILQNFSKLLFTTTLLPTAAVVLVVASTITHKLNPINKKGWDAMLIGAACNNHHLTISMYSMAMLRFHSCHCRCCAYNANPNQATSKYSCCCDCSDSSRHPNIIYV